MERKKFSREFKLEAVNLVKKRGVSFAQAARDLPTRCWRAGCGLDQVVAAHLQEAAIVQPVFAHEDCIHCRLHVVIDAARAGALEEAEGSVMGIEHHLLGLAWVGAHKKHSAVAEADMCHLQDYRRVVDANRLMAPVKLVGLAGCKGQRHIGIRRYCAALFCPGLRIAPDCVVATPEARIAEFLKEPDQGQTLPAGLTLVRHQKTIQLLPPGANHRQGLDLAFVLELCRSAA